MSARAFSRIVFVSVTVLTAACGSTPVADALRRESAPASRTAAAEMPPDPGRPRKASLCTILPKAEMEAILGGPLTNVDAADSPGKTQCTYAGFGRFADVAIEWGNGEAGMAGARLAGKFMGATAGQIEVMTPIADLGDEAVMMIGGVLNVRNGPDLITVDLRMQKNPEVVGPVIARRIIDQM
jgi:hypothetical protein